MSEIQIVEGEIFEDARGRISSINNFLFKGVERCYFIHHPDTSVVRGWNGHQHEKKWFCCLRGAFTIALVKIDKWDNPSKELQPEIFHLTDSKMKIVCVPEGYANCIKASIPDSILLVYSGKRISEACNDSWCYDNTMWVDWTKY